MRLAIRRKQDSKRERRFFGIRLERTTGDTAASRAFDTPKENAMKSMKKTAAWLLLGAGMCLIGKSNAWAVTSQPIDIKVSISATKSLSAATTTYDFGPLAVAVSSVSATSLDITNDSGALIETYTMQGANANSTGGGTNWTLAASPGSDTYALAAQFSTARPADADGSWGSDDLTASAVAASDTQFGNGTHAEAATGVAPSGVRSLWFRIKTPTAVSDTSERKETLTLAVQ